MRVSVRRTKSAALNELLTTVKTRMEHEPLLVFIASDEQDAVDTLAQMMEEFATGIPFNKVLTRADVD